MKDKQWDESQCHKQLYTQNAINFSYERSPNGFICELQTAVRTQGIFPWFQVPIHRDTVKSPHWESSRRHLLSVKRIRCSSRGWAHRYWPTTHHHWLLRGISCIHPWWRGMHSPHHIHHHGLSLRRKRGKWGLWKAFKNHKNKIILEISTNRIITQ